MAFILPDPYPERRLPEYCWRSWPPRHTDDCGCTTEAGSADVPSGWECPRCRRVWSPSVLACHHCPVPPSFIAKGEDPGPIEVGR